MNQQTIRSRAAVSGPLVHTQGHATVVFSPAPEDTGWVFIRNDLPESPHIPCRPENIAVRYKRCTTVCKGSACVSVTEHVLATCQGLGIDNLFISVNADGLPMPDGGSAMPFVDALLGAGIVRQAKPRNFFRINHPIFVVGSRTDPMTGETISSQSYGIALPGDDLEVIYVLEYPNTSLGTQMVKVVVSPEEFIEKMAPARSFITNWELDRLQFGPGISEVPVVHSAQDSPQRLSLEEARHKALDLIGDLALLGRPVRGTLIGIRSGHRLNQELVLSLAKGAMND